jgi:hypothetical protein
MYGADLVADAHQQQAAFGAVYGDLPDEFVETLTVEFLPDGADAGFPRLPLLQTLVEFFLEVEDVLLGGGGGGDGLDPGWREAYQSCCFSVVYSRGGRMVLRMSSV